MFRAYSTKRAPTVATRFPTKYNAVRSAWKQKILLPEGLVHNPSPASPTPLETPAAFVPPTDKRTVHKYAGAQAIETMPRLSPPVKRTDHLTAADFIEIQRLRDSQPNTWTRRALAKKFKVSEFVIGLASKPNPQRDAEMQDRLATIKGMWNDKRARAREHRQRRKLHWLRDA